MRNGTQGFWLCAAAAHLHRRRALAISLLGALATAVALAPAAQALSSTPAKTYVTNGPVNAVVPTTDAIYIGGGFTRVAPRTGPGVGIDSSTAKSTGLPEVSGGGQTVRAAEPDGSGGFYIGGDFTRVGGLARSNLAHILADGSVDPGFDPNPNRHVYAIAVSGSTVYVGGDFTSIGGRPRNYIVALDATTGAVTSWNPSARYECCAGSIRALRVSGSTVYAGGIFTHIGGKPRNNIAALNRTTGAARSWNPNAGLNGGGDIPFVQALLVSGSTVYAGGRFDHIGGKARRNIAALDVTTGAARSWNPNANDPVSALRVSGSTVYAGGIFTSIGGQSRNSIAALDATTGAATSWNPNVNGAIYALRVSGSTVYAGGRFGSIGDQARNNIAALNRTTGAARSWNPSANPVTHDGVVNALAVSGSTVYAGGYFTSIGGQTRNFIAALDPTTGAATSWNPDASDQVSALRVSGSTVYAGGNFTSIGGQTRNFIAALDPTTGAATSWNPVANNAVFALAVSGSTVYAGGDFGHIGGQNRSHIAALDPTTGAATSWNPNANGAPDATGAIYTLRLSGSTVYAGGNFTSIGGQSRNNIAALDATTGAATSWNPNATRDDAYAPIVQVNALAVSGSTVYAGGWLFSSIGGQPRNNIAALDPTTGAATSWSPNASDQVNALAVSGSTVYVGGRFTSIGGQPRNNIAALDATTGAARSWNPNAIGPIRALAFGPDGSLWVGGEFTGFAGAPQSGIARFAP